MLLLPKVRLCPSCNLHKMVCTFYLRQGMIHLLCADSKEKQFVFQVGMKRKHSSFLDQNQKVVAASAYVLVQKSLVYVVWFQPPQDSLAALWFHQGRLALFAVTVRASLRGSAQLNKGRRVTESCSGLGLGNNHGFCSHFHLWRL